MAHPVRPHSYIKVRNHFFVSELILVKLYEVSTFASNLLGSKC